MPTVLPPTAVLPAAVEGAPPLARPPEPASEFEPAGSSLPPQAPNTSEPRNKAPQVASTVFFMSVESCLGWIGGRVFWRCRSRSSVDSNAQLWPVRNDLERPFPSTNATSAHRTFIAARAALRSGRKILRACRNRASRGAVSQFWVFMGIPSRTGESVVRLDSPPRYRVPPPPQRSHLGLTCSRPAELRRVTTSSARLLASGFALRLLTRRNASNPRCMRTIVRIVRTARAASIQYVPSVLTSLLDSPSAASLKI